MSLILLIISFHSLGIELTGDSRACNSLSLSTEKPTIIRYQISYFNNSMDGQMFYITRVVLNKN